MKCALKLMTLGLSVMAAGCVASADFVRNAEHYNLAVEKAQTEMLLLNILRAKDHMPLYLTDMSKLNGSVSRKVTGGGTAGLSTTWSRGGTGPAHTLLRPFGLSSGFEVVENPSFQVDVLSTQEFMQGFLTPVSQAKFVFLLKGGWPPDLLFHLLVQRVRLTCSNKSGLPGKTWSNHPSSLDEGPLSEFSDLVREVVGTDKLDSKIEVVEDASTVTIGETAEPVTLEELVAAGKEGFQVKHESGSLSWQLLSSQIRVQLRLNNWVYFEQKCKPQKDDGKPLATRGLMQQSLEAPPKGAAETVPDNAESYVQSVVFEMRSPEGVLYYLGQLARLGEKGSSLGLPRSCDGYMTRPIFVLRKGPCSQAASACVNYQGESYIVPKRDDQHEIEAKCMSKGSFGPLEIDDATGGESMHVLSLLVQLIALQKNAKEFEGTPVVRVIGQ